MVAGSSTATLGNRLTPLHLAAQKGNAIILCLLLAKGANPAAKDAAGKTPLDFILPALRRDTEEAQTVTEGEVQQHLVCASVPNCDNSSRLVLSKYD